MTVVCLKIKFKSVSFVIVCYYRVDLKFDERKSWSPLGLPALSRRLALSGVPKIPKPRL